jgi:hypothetical protein
LIAWYCCIRGVVGSDMEESDGGLPSSEWFLAL